MSETVTENIRNFTEEKENVKFKIPLMKKDYT